MIWSVEDVIEYLMNDYVVHYKNKQHYDLYDNEVDSNYEGAQCDYIFDLLKKIRGCTDTDLADELQDKIDGVVPFNPQDPVDLYPIKKGDTICLMEDVRYSDYDSFIGILDEEEAAAFLEDVGYLDSNNDVIIPKGTYMKFIDVDMWPVFDVHGYELDFAGEGFKIRIIK